MRLDCVPDFETRSGHPGARRHVIRWNVALSGFLARYFDGPASCSWIASKRKEVGETPLRKELLIAPVGEAVLILVVSLAAWFAHQPLVFASLGPTAYELIETPHRKSSRPYNVIVGHAIAVAAGFGAVWLSGAFNVSAVSLNTVPLARVGAAVIAALLTVLVTLLARATQPAALSTTLLIALGMMRTWRAAVIILLGVLLITAVGEPLRRWRLRYIPLPPQQ